MSVGKGRPSKYRPEYCDKFIDVMSNGGFIETFCADVEIHVDTYYEWIKAHEDFAEAVKKGRNIAKAKFLEKMHDAAWDSEKHKVNNGLIVLLGVNCHGLKSKRDDDHGAIDNIAESLSEIAGKLKD